MMNNELVKLLNELDKLRERNNEHSISSKIKKATEEDQSTEAVAERIAFEFCEDYSRQANGWGTYYGPMSVWASDDGNTYESPSISFVNNEVIEYWKIRSKSTNNPIMKARYSGLVWDLSETAIGEKPDYRIAIDYVNALLDVTNEDLCKHPTEIITKITRAYKVSSSLNNSELIERCIASAINLEDRIAEDDKAGSWGFCFKLFVLSKSRNLSRAQENKLIEDLES